MIRLTDFTVEEKVKIAKRDYLLPGIFRDFDETVKENCQFTDDDTIYLHQLL